MLFFRAELLELYEAVHFGVECIGYGAKHVESDADPSSLDFPQIGLVGAGHSGKISLRKVRGKPSPAYGLNPKVIRTFGQDPVFPQLSERLGAVSKGEARGP